MRREHLQEVLDEAIAAADAPGAGLAVLEGEQIEAVSTGFANAYTAIAATSETAFHVGSITKSFTATLAMQLVDEGTLALDSTLTDLLPELRTARADLAVKVRLRDLLCHTSGLDGDLIVDTGEADDYLTKFVEACNGIDFIHEPGAFFSYCNVGYILLGRIIEIARGKPFDTVLREHLFAPLGLAGAETLPDRVPAGRLARGHARGDAGWVLQPPWPRSNTPSGSRLFMRPCDLAMFARFHLSAASCGTATLSSDAARVMRRCAVTTPYSLRNRAWGLGWMRFDWGGEDIFGHDGGLCGTASFLRVAPRTQFAVALSVNGPDHAIVYKHVMRAILGAHLKIEAPPPTPAPDPTIPYDRDALAGRYARRGLFAEVAQTDGGLAVRSGGEFGDPSEPVTKLTPIGKNMFLTRLPGATSDIPLAFFAQDSKGRPTYIHFLDRAYRRSSA